MNNKSETSQELSLTKKDKGTNGGFNRLNDKRELVMGVDAGLGRIEVFVGFSGCSRISGSAHRGKV
jgi:hypothetical protein